MGRNKIKIKPIENQKLRQVTYCKRKKGLLKKTMELSLLCKIQVFLALVDHNDNLAIYNSEGHISNFVDKYLKFPINPKEMYTNQDYQIIFEDEAEMVYKKSHMKRGLDSDDERKTITVKPTTQSVQEESTSPPKERKRSKKRKFIRKMQTIGSRFSFKDKYNEPGQPVIYINNTSNSNKIADNDNINKGKVMLPNSMVIRNKNIIDDNDETFDINIDAKDNYTNDGNGNRNDLIDNNITNLNKLQNKLNLKVNIPNDVMTINTIDDKSDTKLRIKPSKFIQALYPHNNKPSQTSHPFQIQQLHPLHHQQLKQPPLQKQGQGHQISKGMLINQKYMNDYTRKTFKSPSFSTINNHFKIPMSEMDNQLKNNNQNQQYSKKILSFKEILHTLSPSTIRDQEEKYNWGDTPYTPMSLNQKRNREETSNSLSPNQSHLKTQFYQPQGFNAFANQSPLTLTDKKCPPSNNFEDSFSMPAFLYMQQKHPSNNNTNTINSNNKMTSNNPNNPMQIQKNDSKEEAGGEKSNFFKWLNSTK